VEAEPELPAAITDRYDNVLLDALDSRDITPPEIDVDRRVKPQTKAGHLEMPDFVVAPPAASDRRRKVGDLPPRL
jgi:hypothetical protein